MKKKLVILITTIFLCNCCFAGIVLQAESAVIGLGINFSEDCFDTEEPKRFSFEGERPLSSIISNLMWEFNSKNTDTNFHFMTGVGVGIAEYGISLTFPMVFEFTLARFEKTMLELSFNPNLGIAYGLFCGEFFYFVPSVDLIWGRKDRKWLYGGIGLAATGTYYNAAYYKDFGWQQNFYATIGFHLLFGVKFPSW